ncbi:1,2-phenylacetyl-CoA epoxidase subunit PaaE [Demetria terragena]|uniref:1,2-phenylacetyl-CoA epoxidase subunit PaaE n=1 Tax=Demetria terragena TaxID=63959 RepID=UPI00037DB32B|nr:1,2-phenylacetyl-CoA epoxidase subunit PaaE [Demetria terragena]
MSLLTSVPKRTRPRFHELVVADKQTLTDDAVAVTFAVPPGLAETFAFEPGQHLTLKATINGQEERRSYSICLSRKEARERGVVRVGVGKVLGGAMSTWVHDTLEVGDTVEVMSPLGTFTCPTDVDARRHHVAVAAGTGITPVLSLLRTVLEEEPQSRATLIFGNRRTDSVMFLEELEDLKNAYPGRFHLIHVLSREPRDVELFTGRIDAARLERITGALVPVDSVAEWYLCGPFGMVEDAQGFLEQRGVAHEHVHHEIFHVDDDGKPTPPPVIAADLSAPPEAVVTINLDGRTTQVPMPTKTETVLAATLRERPDAPFSCTGGVCGTCRARVVDGEVTMDRNYALEPEEVAAGIVLACQSHPVTDTVTLDYDA